MKTDKKQSFFYGKKLKIQIFGGSHDKEIGTEISGLKGEKVDLVALQEFVDRRKAKKSAYSTNRLEQDKVEIVKGVKNGVIKGKVRAVIKNNCQNSKDYSNLIKTPRPSHADFVAYSKYKDTFDYRGGGKFSGRLTAPMTIAGGIAKQILLKKGITINAYISKIGAIDGASYKDTDIEKVDLNLLDKEFPLLDDAKKEQMLKQIEDAKNDLDSVGGVIECVVKGVPVGAGEYMFDSLEGVISKLMFAVPAVKGIEFGTGFDLAGMKGSTANDSFYYDGEIVKTKTNNNGGINGGLANGMPITFRVVIKPTPSIYKEQDTVDLVTKQNAKIKIEGRHDACITPRAVPVVEAVTAIAILDSLEL